VGEVAIGKIRETQKIGVFNTPRSFQTPKNAYFLLFALIFVGAIVKLSFESKGHRVA